MLSETSPRFAFPVLFCALSIHAAVGMAADKDFSETKVVQSRTVIHVLGENKLIVRHDEEIIVADESGKDYGFDAIRETDFVKFRNLDARIYDASGKLLKKLKKKDIQESSMSFSSVYHEHKTKFYSLSVPELPYRIVKSKEYEIKTAFLWPDWDPQERVIVEHAILQVVLKQPVEFEYRNIGGLAEPRIHTDADGSKKYLWEIDDVPAFESEYRYAPEASFQMGVRFMPKKFELAGFQGTSSSWRTFGAWYFDLIRDRLSLSGRYVPEASLSGVSSRDQIIKQIYHLLQAETRYVQIYLNEGGWRPHHVDQVRKMKYGDCKDLSALMIAMLAQAGIEAYPALVLTRDRGWIDPGFTTNNFNHCIAVVPSERDTLWLECTSDVTPYDDPPAGIEGVNALLIKPDGGQLVRTPVSRAEKNRSKLVANAQLQNDRLLKIDGTLTFTGNKAISIRATLKDFDQDKQKDWLVKRFSHKAGDASCNSMNIRHLDQPDSLLTIDFQVDLKYFARKAGARYIIEPRLFHRWTFDGEAPSARTMPLLNMTRFVEEDSVRFVYPATLSMRGSAKKDTIHSQFGEYSFEISPQSNGLSWRSSFVSLARSVPLADYNDYYDFMVAVGKEAKRKIVLQKK